MKATQGPLPRRDLFGPESYGEIGPESSGQEGSGVSHTGSQSRSVLRDRSGCEHKILASMGLSWV